MTKSNNFFNEKEIKTISEYIEKYQFDNILKILLMDWLQTSEMQNILLEKPFIINGFKRGRSITKAAIINRFIDPLAKFILKQEDFTWGNYCSIMHEIPLTTTTFQLTFRQMTRSLYLYAFSSDTVTDYQVKSFILMNNNLLLTEEYTKIKGEHNYSPYINNCVRTNFPMNSSVENIFQVEYVSRKNSSTRFANFYVPACSDFLINTLKAFLLLFPKRGVNNGHNRIMVALFDDSLGDHEVNRLESFNEQTFKQQLFYFDSFSETYHSPLKKSFRGFLVKFYRYIDDIYLEKNGKRLFNSFSFNRELIIHFYYLNSIKQGYEIVNPNSLGTYPESDKWFVVVDTNKHGSHVVHSSNSLVNFELVHNIEFRNVLKDFFWKLDNSNLTISNKFSILVNFLNEADTYYQQELQVLQLKNELSEGVKPFSSRFLIFYRASLMSNNKYKDSTINAYISYIRLFMKHIENQYNIPKLTIEQFTSSIDVEEAGGTPIPLEDFNEIHKVFERKFNNENEIMLIILHLGIETKMRIGEILSLERDCIVSIDESDKFGTIKYYSKTSGRKKVKEVFLMEHIRLLQKAIKLTQPLYEMADNSLRKYIFLCAHNRYKKQVILAKEPFNKAFATISKDLFTQGKVRLKYTPNNLRHTYIDKAWQMVEDDLVSTLEVSVITGNTASVAKKHYRNRENTKRYVEAIYEVSILDDELAGSIIDNENIENLPPVQAGAGSCASESCVKIDTDEDSFYKCLTCKKFVTTVERSPFFEQQIEIYKDKKENSKSTVERNFYTGLIELYGRYLAEMYAYLEGKV